MEEKEYQKYIGGMWSKTANNEKKSRYYSCTIEKEELLKQCNGELPDKIRFHCFRNYRKIKESHPDYNLLLFTQDPNYKPKEKETIKEMTQEEKDKAFDEEIADETEKYINGEIPF